MYTYIYIYIYIDIYIYIYTYIYIYIYRPEPVLILKRRISAMHREAPELLVTVILTARILTM